MDEREDWKLRWKARLRTTKLNEMMNAKKTEYIAYNLPAEGVGTVLREVDDFKYLRSWVNSTDRDVKVRRA